MKLTILGSGSYQPELERHSSAYLIQTVGQNICFDFGRGAIDQLFKVGLHVNQLDAVFISHWHGDHINDLTGLLQITISPPRDHGYWPVRKKPLKIFGPEGTLESIRKIVEVIHEHQDLDNLEIQELEEGDSVNIGTAVLKAYLAKHNPNIIPLCYRLESEGKVLAYSGDTVESEGLAKAISNADVAVIEAGWPASVEPKTHLTGPRTGKFAYENKVKKLVITHISPYYIQEFNPKAEVEQEFKGEVIVAKDLLQIEV